MNVRIATFNCENLFARYLFKSGVSTSDISEDGFSIDDTKFDFLDKQKRRITGNTIKHLDADVIALQEVENLDVLKRFRSRYLGGFKAFPHVMLIDSNDPRYIDVAVLSKYPIIHARSYQQMKKSSSSRRFIFSRDCLEVEIDFKGTSISLFVNHFKSMMGGRSNTKARRLEQVKTVKSIIENKFGKNNTGNHQFVILGDFNDYIEHNRPQESSLPELVYWNEVENVVDRLPIDERWTHYYSKKKSYSQLDYILVSKSLSNKVNAVEIDRRGTPKRATKYTGERYHGVGMDNPKASDHCPVVVELTL